MVISGLGSSQKNLLFTKVLELLLILFLEELCGLYPIVIGAKLVLGDKVECLEFSNRALLLLSCLL